MLSRIVKNLTLYFNVTDVLALSTNKAWLITDTVAAKTLWQSRSMSKFVFQVTSQPEVTEDLGNWVGY